MPLAVVVVLDGPERDAIVLLARVSTAHTA